LDRENRTVFLQNTDLKNNLYKLYDIDWVNNDKYINKRVAHEIDAQYLLI
jgi:hypothetical protein